MHAGPITAVAQQLLFTQQRLQALTADAYSRLRTPDGFSPELHAERDTALMVERLQLWHWRQWLPDVAPNDPQRTLPGAA